MKNTVIAEYITSNKITVKEQFSKEEITKFGLKNVIRYHAKKLKIKKYTCNVIFEKDIQEGPKIFHNPLNRLVARISLKSLNKLMEVYKALTRKEVSLQN